MKLSPLGNIYMDYVAEQVLEYLKEKDYISFNFETLKVESEKYADDLVVAVAVVQEVGNEQTERRLKFFLLYDLRINRFVDEYSGFIIGLTALNVEEARVHFFERYTRGINGLSVPSPVPNKFNRMYKLV